MKSCGRATPKVAVFQDLSGLGRCALSVALPVLSVMGAQACAIPTMALSVHTGGFGAVCKQELSGFMEGALRHWGELRIRFDAVYMGYMASDGQLALCDGFLDSQSAPGDHHAFVLFDPAMADCGRLYSGIQTSRVNAARAMCARADLIAPNLTEALLLLDLEPGERPIGQGELAKLLRDLIGLGCGASVITGVELMGGEHVNAYLAAGAEEPLLIPYEQVPERYSGTGDLFASALLGALLRGESAESGIRRAASFCQRAALRSYQAGAPVREGVQFEALLGELLPRNGDTERR